MVIYSSYNIRVAVNFNRFIHARTFNGISLLNSLKNSRDKVISVGWTERPSQKKNWTKNICPKNSFRDKFHPAKLGWKGTINCNFFLLWDYKWYWCLHVNVNLDIIIYIFVDIRTSKTVLKTIMIISEMPTRPNFLAVYTTFFSSRNAKKVVSTAKRGISTAFSNRFWFSWSFMNIYLEQIKF